MRSVPGVIKYRIGSMDQFLIGRTAERDVVEKLHVMSWDFKDWGAI